MEGAEDSTAETSSKNGLCFHEDMMEEIGRMCGNRRAFLGYFCL